MVRRFISVVGLNASIIVAGLVLAEIVFGSWFSTDKMGAIIVQRDVLRTFDVSDLYPGGTTATYTRDRYGLRGDYGEGPADIDVVVLGGSTTNEIFVSDDQTWVSRLQARFEAGGQDIRFANAGIDGQSTRGNLQALGEWLAHIPGLSPRYVLVYAGINDLVLDHHDNQDQLLAASRAEKIKRYAMNNSALYRLFKVVRGNLRARNARVNSIRYDAFRTKSPCQLIGEQHQHELRIRVCLVPIESCGTGFIPNECPFLVQLG